MAAELKPYPTYKDSGVSWLGDVPAHWTVRRIKTLFREKDERTSDGTGLLLSLTRTWGLVPQSEASNRLASAGDLSKYRICMPGDLVMNRMQAWSGMFAVSRLEGLVSPDYSVFEATEPCAIKHFEYLFKARQLVDQFAQASKGIGTGFNRLYTPDFGAVPILIPPLREQAAIVRFLDHADRSIRRCIHAKQKLIALLEEQKKVIVHEAVTGRVDVRTGRRYPVYKDSVVEWLGDIPEQWQRTRLKTVLCRPTRNGLFKKKEHFGTGVPLVNVADVYRDDLSIDASSLERVEAGPDEVRRFRVQDGDIFFVRSSLKLEGTGRAAIAASCSKDTVFECHLVQARPDARRVNPRYLVVSLNSHTFRHYLISRANMVTMATIAQDTISSCPIVAPARSEQDGIVEWIDKKWRELSRAIEDANRQIVLLGEYRSRLIADVVAGRVDVRKEAARLAEVAPLGFEGDVGLDGTACRNGAEVVDPVADLGDVERSEVAAG